MEDWDDAEKVVDVDPPYPAPLSIYNCYVTNTGFIGVTIETVDLFFPDPGRPTRFQTYARRSTGHIQREDRLVTLRPLEDEDPRKLDPSESQKWARRIEDTDKERIRNTLHGYPVDTKIIAVALDTTGKRYWQKTKDALSYKDVMYAKDEYEDVYARYEDEYYDDFEDEYEDEDVYARRPRRRPRRLDDVESSTGPVKEEDRAPVRYPRRSGGRTEAVVA